MVPENELKQQRLRRLRKCHLKSEFALLQTLSRLFHLVYFVKCWQMFLELNSKGLYQSSGEEKQSSCLVFPSSTKREFRHFHVVVVQRRLRNVQKKRDARAKSLFCLSKPIAFFPSPLPSPSLLLKLPNRELKIRRRRRQRQRELHKSNRFNDQNNNFARASRFFVHFFADTVRLRRENA